jgi:3-hydroxybutyryl-CoA dehydrogenase
MPGGAFSPARKAPGHCIDTRKGARLKIGDCYQLSGGEEHMEICSLGVVGAGQMGSGIAQVAARSGFEVVIHDIHEESVQRGMDVITRNLTKEMDRGGIGPAERIATLGRIKPSTDLDDLKTADFVVEAVPEKEELKFQVFRKLDGICAPKAILSTNTSSISIGRIGSQTRRPERVIGMHFMNPVPRMPLVEVVRSLITSEDTFQTTWKVADQLGKTPVEANDFPGFISNRILMPMINEAIFALHERVGSREAIDTVMRLGMNHDMGPLATADLIGLDTCLAIMETLCDGFSDSKYRPCPLLRRYVEAGWLGRKTGRGFFEYS